MASGQVVRSFDLQPEGCIVGVTLRSFSAAAPPLRVRGLLDTGASDICIDYRMAETLGLEEIDQQWIGTASGRALARVFSGIVEAHELGFLQPMSLYALNARRPTHDILLGRAFMRRFIVTFDGPGGVVHFAKPYGPIFQEWDG